MSKFGIRKKIQERNGKNFILVFSIGLKGVKLHLVKEIQISHQMTIYGQTLVVFKRETNECSGNGKKTKMHKNKAVVFCV